ncbi:hypothetical protein HY642_01035, partial [Candidatus Woesearchaeota archaeon]|nr:hypothetical protein [Candidatus Woesearchaeota archaeon]
MTTRVGLDILPAASGTAASWRIRTHLYFRQKGSALRVLVPAWVDTGASFTTLPKSIWANLDLDIVCPFEAYGAVKTGQCKLYGHLAYIPASIGGHDVPLTPERRMLAFCVANHPVPVLFGMKDCIDAFRLVVDV